MADPPNTQSYTQFQHNTAYVPASCLVTWCDWTINPNDTWHSLSWAKNQAYQATVAAAGASRQKRKWFCLEFWGCWLRFRSCLALRWKRCSRNLDAFSQRQSAMLWLCFLSAPAGAKTADKVSNIFQLQIPKAGTENNGFGSWTARPTVQSVHVFPSTVPHKEPRHRILSLGLILMEQIRLLVMLRTDDKLRLRIAAVTRWHCIQGEHSKPRCGGCGGWGFWGCSWSCKSRLQLEHKSRWTRSWSKCRGFLVD